MSLRRGAVRVRRARTLARRLTIRVRRIYRSFVRRGASQRPGRKAASALGKSLIRAAWRIPAPWSQGGVSLRQVRTGSARTSGPLLPAPSRPARSRLSVPWLAAAGTAAGLHRPDSRAGPCVLPSPAPTRPDRFLVAGLRPVASPRPNRSSASVIWCLSQRGWVISGSRLRVAGSVLHPESRNSESARPNSSRGSALCGSSGDGSNCAGYFVRD